MEIPADGLSNFTGLWHNTQENAEDFGDIARATEKLLGGYTQGCGLKPVNKNIVQKNDKKIVGCTNGKRHPIVVN